MSTPSLAEMEIKMMEVDLEIKRKHIELDTKMMEVDLEIKRQRVELDTKMMEADLEIKRQQVALLQAQVRAEVARADGLVATRPSAAETGTESDMKYVYRVEIALSLYYQIDGELKKENINLVKKVIAENYKDLISKIEFTTEPSLLRVLGSHQVTIKWDITKLERGTELMLTP